MKHVIVEGPDGSGKSTLVKALREIGMKPAPRASNSIQGPVADLMDWVIRDQQDMIARWDKHVYDRHPLISEPIYGRIVRDNPAEGFNNPSWMVSRIAHLYVSTLVVWCMPPLYAVEENANLTADNQMAGVVDHIEDLYMEYEKVKSDWAGPAITYDYTIQNADNMVSLIKDLSR